ncbi:hypothetical protein [Haloarchaeobius iranensis]|uniref:Uncharacterized protein n=2 Tax=Haloarchaeobius iranensis TaxID=996166 RepID=A0A1G9Y687_9EURY|nr:hypothetical protein [Haloarchaeobius iranensis]SDN04166.1 hypothetical protein SAMN05192554_1139 [Haloarchaeobius iranensis]
MDERRGTVGGALTTALGLAGLGYAARRLAGSRVTDVPLSPLVARGRVGGDWVARAGVGTGDHPVGEMDDMAAFAGDGFDPELVDPDVRAFYERTSEHALSLTAEWHRPFRTGAWLASQLTGRMEQLNLPAPGDGRTVRLRSEFERIDPALDPRDGARMWVRTDADTGDGVFVAAYGSHVADGERYVNIGVPLPGCNLSTVLSLRNLDDGAVALTTEAAGDPGLYLLTPSGSFELPMAQRFRVWPADGAAVPTDVPRTDETAIVATHEMWLYGQQFLTVRYAGQTSTSTS